MPTATAEHTTSTTLERCAVCKIDLKGRIVYLNDELESLFGAGLEELFGRPLDEFLDEQSQEVLHSVMSNRSHTESAFDATSMMLHPVKGKPQPVVAIMSLNFIAGNPVNYQIIISRTALTETLAPKEAPVAETATDDTTSESSADMLGHLLSLESEDHLAHVVRAVGELVNAEYAALYSVNGETLTTVFPSDPKTGSPKFETLPLTTELHRAVVRSGEEYDFTDEQSIQRATELVGDAPNEYVTVLEGVLDGSYVIRVAFGDDYGADNAVGAIEQVRRIVTLMRHLAGHDVDLPKAPEPQVEKPAEESESSNQEAVEPTLNPAELLLDLFERFGLGVAIAERGADVFAANTFVSELFKGSTIADSLDDLRRGVSQCNKHIDLDAIVEAAGSADRATPTEILTPSGRPCELLVAGSLIGEGSEVWLFKPLPSGAPAGSTRAKAEALPDHDLSVIAQDGNFWSNVIGVIAALGGNIRTHGEWLAHSFYNQFGPDGNDQIRALNDNTRLLSDLIGEIGELDSLLGSEPQSIPTDLSMLADEVAKKLTEQFPHRTFEFELANLPKCSLPLAWMKLALENIMIDAVHRTLGELVRLKVTAEVSESSCLLVIDDNSDLSPDENNSGGFKIDPSTGDLSDLVSIDRWRTELPIARYLIERLEGVLDRTFEPDRGLTTTIMVPVDKKAEQLA